MKLGPPTMLKLERDGIRMGVDLMNQFFAPELRPGQGTCRVLARRSMMWKGEGDTWRQQVTSPSSYTRPYSGLCGGGGDQLQGGVEFPGDSSRCGGIESTLELLPVTWRVLARRSITRNAPMRFAASAREN